MGLGKDSGAGSHFSAVRDEGKWMLLLIAEDIAIVKHTLPHLAGILPPTSKPF